MATWPASLPGFSMSGYEQTPGENVIRTDMQAGHARARRQYMAVPTEIKASFQMTGEELRTFRQFYNETINHGVKMFDINVYVDKEITNVKNVRFTKPYTARLTALDLWSVECEFETLDELPVSG